MKVNTTALCRCGWVDLQGLEAQHTSCRTPFCCCTTVSIHQRMLGSRSGQPSLACCREEVVALSNRTERPQAACGPGTTKKWIPGQGSRPANAFNAAMSRLPIRGRGDIELESFLGVFTHDFFTQSSLPALRLYRLYFNSVSANHLI